MAFDKGMDNKAPLGLVACLPGVRRRVLVAVSQRRRLIKVVVFFRLEQLYGLGWHDRRNSMLVDQLRMPVAAQENGKIVKPRNNSLQFDSVYEKDRNGRFVFPDVIKKHVLNVLISFG